MYVCMYACACVYVIVVILINNLILFVLPNGIINCSPQLDILVNNAGITWGSDWREHPESVRGVEGGCARACVCVCAPACVCVSACLPACLRACARVCVCVCACGYVGAPGIGEGTTNLNPHHMGLTSNRNP